MENQHKHTIIVTATPVDGRVNIDIGFLRGEPKLGYDETAHILASAICLLIKGSNQTGYIKEHELIDDIIRHIQSEFININSFNDVMIRNDEFLK